jgi:DNA-binding transcriptional LysR family regulator
LSFTLAASDLCVTQSAVTQRVRAFEDECELKFFGRRKGKIFLTEEGKLLLKYTTRLFKYEREIEKAIRETKELKRGTLRIGLPKSLSPQSISLLMDSYHQEYPNIRIEVNEGSSRELIQGILDHKSEIAFLAKVEEHRDLDFIHLSREKVVLVMGPRHRLAKEKVTSLKALENEQLIMREKGSGTRKLVVELFEKNQYVPNIILESSNVENIKKFVERGDGVTFLVQGAVLSEIEQGKLVMVPMEEDGFFIDVYLAYLKDIPFSVPARAYLKLFAKSIPESSETSPMVASWRNNWPLLD